jgi:hypothetical protein
MDRLAESEVTDLPTQENKTAKGLLVRIVNEVQLPPAGWSFADPGEVYAVAFDKPSNHNMALTEVQRLMQNGFGHVWVGMTSGVTAGGGGHLNYVDRVSYQGALVQGQFDIDITMDGLAVEYARDTLINRCKVTYDAREIGGSAVVLHAIAAPIPIPVGETLEIQGEYTDPANPDRKIGGTDFEAFTAGTDYRVWSNSDGTGVELTNFGIYATVNAGDEPGGSKVTYTITNLSFMDGWITVLQIRGKPIYFSPGVAAVYEDADSVRRYDVRPFDVSLAYQGEPERALALARHVVLSRKSTLPTARELFFHADASEGLMTQALAREPGDLIEIKEAVTLGPAYRRAYIQRKRLQIRKGGLLDCTWSLTPQNPQGGYWVLGRSKLGVDTVLAWK